METPGRILYEEERFPDGMALRHEGVFGERIWMKPGVLTHACNPALATLS